MFCFACNIFACLHSFIYELFSSLMQNSLALFLIAALFAIVIFFNIYSASMLCEGMCGNSRNINNNSCSHIDEYSEENESCQEENPMCSCALERSSSMVRQKPNQRPSIYFDYSFEHGPHTWRAASNNQSPINIEMCCLREQRMFFPLQFMHFNEVPRAIELENNGRTLKLRACFNDKTPSISGGELLSWYKFIEISFRWSSNDSEGSEHTIDNVRYPLEMQALYYAGDDQQCGGSGYELLMLSYLFDIAAENPFFDSVFPYLTCIQDPGTSIEIPPFPLAYLMPEFNWNFYSYDGSQTEPPCQRGVEWYINPELLAIGPRQLNELRQLRGCNGTRITSNSRPVQPLDERTVYFNVDAKLKNPSSSSCSSSRGSRNITHCSSRSS